MVRRTCFCFRSRAGDRGAAPGKLSAVPAPANAGNVHGQSGYGKLAEARPKSTIIQLGACLIDPCFLRCECLLLTQADIYAPFGALVFTGTMAGTGGSNETSRVHPRRNGSDVGACGARSRATACGASAYSWRITKTT